ncbi:MAG: hypothetical protein HY331_00555 [Chloroflexi bacterium]|nr:hypothetical protein [Chloroflexota bacterium]
MRTEIYESDPFSPRKGKHLTTLDTDYRFEKNDEITIEGDGSPVRVRVMHVRLHIRSGTMHREILALRL